MASTAAATPPTSPRRLFKPSSTIKTRTTTKSTSINVTGELSPPPPQPRDHSGGKGDEGYINNHCAQRPPATPPRRGSDSKSGFGVFSRSASIASTVHSRHRSPSTTSECTPKPSQPPSLVPCTDAIDGPDDPLHDLPKTPPPLTPTQIFMSRGRMTPLKSKDQPEKRHIQVEQEDPTADVNEDLAEDTTEESTEDVTKDTTEHATEHAPKYKGGDDEEQAGQSSLRKPETEEDTEEDKETRTNGSLHSQTSDTLSSGVSFDSARVFSPEDLIQCFTDNEITGLGKSVEALDVDHLPDIVTTNAKTPQNVDESVVTKRPHLISSEETFGSFLEWKAEPVPHEEEVFGSFLEWKSEPIEEAESSNKASASSRMATPKASSSDDPTRSKPVRRPGIPNPGKQEDGSHFFDNMGRPVKIERSVDIPLKRGEKKGVSHGLPSPSGGSSSNKSQQGQSKDGLDKMTRVEDLRSTDGLASTDDLDDPPEEYLDPSVHSTHSPANVTPIPRIGAISPIQKSSGGTTVKLSDLAQGLEGFEVDDVGNVVNEKGKVLGYVMGDLPSMVGKKVAEGGKIYGDNGEVLGHVTENFTGDDSGGEENANDQDDLTDALNGLRVDHDGNIMDQMGNIVGRLNERPTSKGRRQGQDGDNQNEQEQAGATSGTGQEEAQDGKNKNKGRIPLVPADISLDVKSTYDGIQIIIKIPSMFKRPPQTITIT
ncbi:DUF3659 domain-containing protein [Microdochium nivale]|nr:DUF3659 domain-containing protein [Microdochium nivale]